MVACGSRSSRGHGPATSSPTSCYNRVPLAKETQLNLWVETCLRLADRSGGRPRDGVNVHTRRVAEPFPTG